MIAARQIHAPGATIALVVPPWLQEHLYKTPGNRWNRGQFFLEKHTLIPLCKVPQKTNKYQCIILLLLSICHCSIHKYSCRGNCYSIDAYLLTNSIVLPGYGSAIDKVSVLFLPRALQPTIKRTFIILYIKSFLMKQIKQPSGIITTQWVFMHASYSVILLLLCSVLFFQSCRKHDFNPPPVGAYDLQLIADGFTSPLVVTESPDGTQRLFVADQTGKIWILNADGSKMSTPFIDISSLLPTLSPFYDERGLLGFAFHPNYKNNGKFYLFYTAPPRAGGPEPGVPWNNLTRISEFQVSASDANMADISSERIILEADHPQMNHDGGTIAFGPDGYLYISIGDGGAGGDIGPGHVSDWYAVNGAATGRM